MPSLLLVNSSPRRERSESLRLAEGLVDAYREVAPQATIDRLDLFEDPLPFFGPDAASAKMKVIGGETLAGGDAALWDELASVVRRLESADALVFPMWNASVPWPLKQLIDVVSQPGLAFRFDPEAGCSGLLEGRRAVAVYTSHVYSPRAEKRFGVDFHSTYFEYWLSFVGISDVRTVRLQPTHRTPDFAERQAAALAQARSIGRALARERIAEAAA